ncbi:MAG TPA: DUF4383 domain-containing protein [Solirubrobacterales bacterium]|jgi:hypothetical protein|nr:DUF4383 domain-containing protein [Solirubrobacterales bacterium]
MQAASPARLYAAAGGAFLVALGIVGFFYSASFGSPGAVEAALGVLRVNAWLNLLYVLAGALGLLAAASAPRAYALAMGLFFTGLAIWGWSLDGAEAILGFLPAAAGDEVLNLTIGVLGLLAAAGTPRPGRGAHERGARAGGSPSEPRANPARQRP